MSSSVIASNISVHSELTANVDDPFDDHEGEEVVLEDILTELGFTQEEKDALEAYILLHMFDDGPEVRSRYYTSSTTYSAADVKKIVDTGRTNRDAATALLGLLGDGANLASATLSAVYALYDYRFVNAADHGWGIKITLTIDSYTPTTAGMTYSYSYIK